MTISIVQETSVADNFVDGLTVHFDAEPTPGNRIIIWAFCAGNRQEVPPPATWSRLYYDAGARRSEPGVTPPSRPPRITGWWNDADPSWQDVAFAVPNVSSTYGYIAYEIAGEFDPELSMVHGWTRGVTDTAATLTVDEEGTLTVPDHAAVFAVTAASTTITGETFTGDRTDTTSVLRCTVDLDAAAGNYTNTVTYSPAAKATGVVFALMDRGEPYVSAVNLPARLVTAAANAAAAADELPGMAVDLLAAADDISDGAVGVQALLDEKDGQIATLEAIDERVLLAPHGPVIDSYDWGEHPYVPDEDRELDGTEIGYIYGQALVTLPDGFTLHIPTGRYRLDTPQTVDGLSNVTVKGQGLGMDLPTFYHVTPGHKACVEFNNIDGLTIQNYRTESTNLVPNLPITRVPLYEPHFPPYDAVLEGDHGLGIVSCNDVLVEDYFAYGMWGDGLTWDQGTPNNTDVVATRVDNRYCGRQTFTCSGVTNGVFSYLWFPNSKRSGVDFEDGPSDHVTFDHGTINTQGSFNAFNCNGPSSTYVTVKNFDLIGGPMFRWASGGGIGGRPGFTAEDIVRVPGGLGSSLSAQGIFSAHQPGEPVMIRRVTASLSGAFDSAVFKDVTNGSGCFHVEDCDFSNIGSTAATRLTYGGEYVAGEGWTIVGRNNRFSSGLRAREVVVNVGVGMTVSSA